MTLYVAEFRDRGDDLGARVGPFPGEQAAIDWLNENDHPTSLVYSLAAPHSDPVGDVLTCEGCRTEYLVARCPKCGDGNAS